jgi:hypothetical protein
MATALVAKDEIRSINTGEVQLETGGNGVDSNGATVRRPVIGASNSGRTYARNNSKGGPGAAMLKHEKLLNTI